MSDRRPLVERFWERVCKLPGEGACWEWTGFRNPGGYGTIGKGGDKSPKLLAHRVSWEIANGPIPPGLYVLHHCDNPGCVRPSHLHLGTDADNQREMAQRRRGYRSKTGMPYGVRRASTKTPRWFVQLRVRGKAIYFGTFKTIEAAAAVARRERERLYGGAE